jgi:lysophospholipase L1-like esterase
MGGAGGKAGTSGAGGTTHTGVWKVMMLGDSVTESTCYPQITYQDLMAANHTNFQFVGMETTNQSCGSGAPASVKDEGHAGYGVTYLPQNNTRGACGKSTGCGSYAELQTWAAEKPDIVLMHFGTNDVWDDEDAPTILSAYLAVISEFRKQNPNVIFFVSKIIKLDPSGCGYCLTNVAALAAALTPSWASSNSTASSPIYIIDHYDSSFDPTNTADTSDGVHPTPAGAAIMATVTVNAIAASGYF